MPGIWVTATTRDFSPAIINPSGPFHFTESHLVNRTTFHLARQRQWNGAHQSITAAVHAPLNGPSLSFFPMTKIPSMIRRLVVPASLLLVSAVSLRAQADPGFLGKRYAGASLFLESIRDSTIDSGTGILAQGNLPVAANIDLNAYASYERFSDYSIRDKRIGATIVAFRDMDHFKPFVEAGLGSTWQSSSVGNVTYKNNDGVFTGGVGVEAPVSRNTSLLLKVDYNRYFDSDNGHYWTYTAGFNSWITEKIGVLGSVAFNDSETIQYSFGAVYRF